MPRVAAVAMTFMATMPAFLWVVEGRVRRRDAAAASAPAGG